MQRKMNPWYIIVVTWMYMYKHNLMSCEIEAWKKLHCIIGCQMLRALGHPVAMCCNMFVRCFWLKFDHFQTWANDTQHVATSHNRVAKYAQQVAPSNVAIYCLEIVQSFGQEFTWIHEIWGTIATVTDFLILFASINIMWCL